MIEKLQTKVQNYDWGKLGSKSKVAQLWGNEIDETKPYAELWMGTHPNGPSFYEDGRALLEDINETTCTKQLFEKYKDLPFLFKVLSIRKALSIQAHPDKTLAARLHKESPSMYKDPNHKPEMAVALTDFEAFVGFRPLEEIEAFLEKYPEFKTITSPYSFEFVNNYKSNEANKKQCLKMLFSALQNSTPEQVTQQVQALISRIAKSNSNDYLDLLILRLNDQYPNDVGIFCALFLNYICLKPGDAIFLAANEPHAYLSGGN
jgi:mannose-6-phosphate isomerase